MNSFYKKNGNLIVNCNYPHNEWLYIGVLHHFRSIQQKSNLVINSCKTFIICWGSLNLLKQKLIGLHNLEILSDKCFLKLTWEYEY